LKNLLNDIGSDHRAEMAFRLSENQRNFLYDAGVDMPSKVVENRHPTFLHQVPVPQALGFQLADTGGNPGQGTIFYFGQAHYTPQLDDGSLCETRVQEIRNKIQESQRSILDGLLALNVKHVFDEGVCETMETPPEEVKRLAQKVFKDYRAGSQLTDVQAEMLTQFGASLVYACLNDGVVLHATSNKETAQNIHKYIEQGSLPHGFKVDREFVFDHRENMAAGFMQKHLRNKPHQPVAFVFGTAHNCLPVLSTQAFSPLVYHKDVAPTSKAHETDLFISSSDNLLKAEEEIIRSQLQLREKFTRYLD
jgi:hypothetical protein